MSMRSYWVVDPTNNKSISFSEREVVRLLLAFSARSFTFRHSSSTEDPLNMRGT